MFRLGRVPYDELVAVAEARAGASVTYPEVGASLAEQLPPGYRHDRRERTLAARPDAFERAVDGICNWAAHRGAGLLVGPSDEPALGATVAVAVRIGPLTAIAPCRVVRVVDDGERFGFAYGTLPGHPEAGEEAFVVARRAEGVAFTITAFSRPSAWLARLGGPLTRRMQVRTIDRYLDGLADHVERAR